MTRTNLFDLARVGRYFFGLAVLASGVMQLVNAGFVRLVPELPGWIPWPSIGARVVGGLLVALGGMIAIGFKARGAAMIFAGMLLLSFLFQRVPQLIADPMTGFMWTAPCKVLALVGGAIMVAGTASGAPARADRGWRLQLLGPLLLGVFLLVCGVQHFI